MNTLGKHERLKHRKKIDELFSSGRSFAVYPIRTYWKIENAGTASLKFGVGVSKRYFKKAVDRNRIKRLIREAYRTQKKDLSLLVDEKQINLDLFMIFTGKEIPSQQDLAICCRNVLDKLHQVLIKPKETKPAG